MAPRILGLSTKSDPASLSTGAVEQRQAAIIAEAERIFGDPAKAHRWLSKPKAHLDGKTPLDVIGTEIGAMLVQSMLVRIEYGMIG